MNGFQLNKGWTYLPPALRKTNNRYVGHTMLAKKVRHQYATKKLFVNTSVGIGEGQV